MNNSDLAALHQAIKTNIMFVNDGLRVDTEHGVRNARELALVRTKLQEAQMWVKEAMVQTPGDHEYQELTSPN